MITETLNTTPQVVSNETHKKPIEEIKKPIKELKQPIEEVKKPIEEEKKPTEEIKKPTVGGDTAMGVTDSIEEPRKESNLQTNDHKSIESKSPVNPSLSLDTSKALNCLANMNEKESPKSGVTSDQVVNFFTTLIQKSKETTVNIFFFLYLTLKGN